MARFRRRLFRFAFGRPVCCRRPRLRAPFAFTTDVLQHFFRQAFDSGGRPDDDHPERKHEGVRTPRFTRDTIGDLAECPAQAFVVCFGLPYGAVCGGVFRADCGTTVVLLNKSARRHRRAGLRHGSFSKGSLFRRLLRFLIDHVFGQFCERGISILLNSGAHFGPGLPASVAGACVRVPRCAGRRRPRSSPAQSGEA